MKITDLKEAQAFRGRQVAGTLLFKDNQGREQVWAVDGRLDAVGPLTTAKVMIAIGDSTGDGIVYMLPNDPSTAIDLEVKD